MINLANGVVGLSLLSGSSSLNFAPSLRVESRTVRAARAQFTLPAVEPLWRQPGPSPTVSALLSRPSLIDRADGRSFPPDVATAFTTYKALDRLRVLAEAGTKGPASAALQQRFAAGLAELEAWLPTAASDKLTLSFGRASRRAESLVLPPAVPPELRGKVVAPQRDAPLAGLSGTERFSLRLSRPGASDTVSIDLSGTPQPPRLDTVAAALNDAIAALPMLDAGGNAIRNADGAIVTRYQARFAVVRSDTGWGLELRSGGIEQVSLREIGSPPALMVLAGRNAGDPLAPVDLARLDLAATDLARTTLPSLGAVDAQASSVQPAGPNGTPAPPVAAALTIADAGSDADGFTYAVGTSNGTLGAQAGDGANDLLLVKLDAQGRQVWQRSLGLPGTASGVSIAIDAGGAITVGGTITSGDSGESDLLIVRFGTDGTERGVQQVRQLGDETMQGMALAADGSAILAARSASGALSLVRLDTAGRVVERQALDPAAGSQIRGIATPPGGDLMLLSQRGDTAVLQRFAGGSLAAAPSSETFTGLGATTLAVAADGKIAIGGQRGGTGTVAVIDGGQTRWTDFASGGSDRIDRLRFEGADLFVAGRTSGTLGAARTGTLDAFVARLDAASGTIEKVEQWGRAGSQSGPVTLAVTPSSDRAVRALGFAGGLINPAEGRQLADLTALRPGDAFSVRINGRSARLVTITADETPSEFADRLGRLIGRSAGRVTLSRSGDGQALRIEPAAGQRIDLLAGPEGRDALAPLGLAPTQLIVPPVFDAKAPRVKPGGHYGLDLAVGLRIGDQASAKTALERIDTAIATVRAGFRSLYWDDTKAALIEGPQRAGSVSPWLAQQLARYRDALSRLGG